MKVIKYDISGLLKLKKALTSKVKVKVGILGENNARDSSHVAGKYQTNSNAVVGARMELGGEFGEYTRIREGKAYTIQKLRIPARSWLFVPIQNHFAEFISGKNDFTNSLSKGNIKDFAAFVGKTAEKTIRAAFLSRGFGDWAGNDPRVALAKGKDTPLRDTDQLMNAVSSKVVGE